MRFLKPFFLLALLFLIWLCPFLPNQPFQDPTPTKITENQVLVELTLTPTPIPDTPTPTVTVLPPTPTPTTTPEILPSLTNESLIPVGLEPITAENIQDLTVVAEIPYHQLKPKFLIYALTFSHDGTKLAIESQNWKNRDHNLMVWDLVSNSSLLDIEEEDPILWGDIYFSPEDDQLWGFCEGFFDQYDLKSDALIKSTAFSEYTGSAVALSPDGKTIVKGIHDWAGTEHSSIYFYEFGSLDPYFADMMAYGIMSFRFSPDSKIVVGLSAKIGGDLRKIWEVETGSLEKELSNYFGPLFSSDSSLAVFVKGDQFYFLSTETWNIEKMIPNKDASGVPACFLGNDKILAIRYPQSIAFIDANTNAELFVLPEQVSIIEYSPKQNIIATHESGGVKLWGIP